MNLGLSDTEIHPFNCYNIAWMDAMDSDQMSDLLKWEDHRSSPLGYVTPLKWKGHCCLTPVLRMAREDPWTGSVRCFPATSQSRQSSWRLLTHPPDQYLRSECELLIMDFQDHGSWNYEPFPFLFLSVFLPFFFLEFEQKCKEHQIPVHQTSGKYINLVLEIRKVIFKDANRKCL